MPLKTDNPRIRAIHVPMTPQERAELEWVAERSGFAELAPFLRMLFLREARRLKREEDAG